MLAAIIIFVAVVGDQLTKYFVVQAASPIIDGKSAWYSEFIPKVMSFIYRENTGAAWSIMDGGGAERVFLLTVSLIAMGMMVYILYKFYNRHILLTISLSMVLGGAIGNMIDRIRLGYVVDFLNTEFMKFPTFNIADCFITIGAVLMAVYIIFYDAKVEARIKAEQEANATTTEENSNNEQL